MLSEIWKRRLITSHFAGGSSGGTAVAIACGVTSMGLGTDTGGSTRIPAALNGIAGFRPSLGRYDTNRVTPVARTRDTVGPMGASVKVLAIMDAVVTGSETIAQPASLTGLRLGVPREYFYNNLAPQVAENMQQVLAKLEAAGVELIEVDMTGLADTNEKVSFPVVLFEFANELPEYLATNKTGVTLTELIGAIASPDVLGAVQTQFGEGAVTQEVYQQAINVFRPKLQAIYQTAFSENNVEAMILPTTILPASSLLGSDETVELNGKREPTFSTYIQNTDPSSNAGLPSLTLPSGKTSLGLPMGVMLDGPIDTDQRLLEIGLAIETILDR